MNFRIDSEFKDYLGALDGESKVALEESLMAEGCRDALVVWPQVDGDPILLDGHNRHAICEDLSIPYRVVNCPVPIADREEAVAWIVRNQRARRNLTLDQLRYFCGKVYQSEKGDKSENLQRGRQTTSPSVQNEHSEESEKTEIRIANEFGISPATVRRNEKFAEAVDAVAAKHGPAAKVEILSGRKKVTDYEPPGEAARESLRVEPDIRSGNHAPIPDFQTVPEMIPGVTPPTPAPPKVSRGSVEIGVFMMDGLSIVLQKLNELVEAGTPDRKTLPAILESIGEAEDKLRELSRALTEGV